MDFDLILRRSSHFATGPTVARARNAGAALNAVGSGHPLSDANRTRVSINAMETATVIDRLRRAVDAHDLEAIVACFAEGYRNDTPVHPARSFVGRDQVRRNWEQILGNVRDLTATVLR